MSRLPRRNASRPFRVPCDTSFYAASVAGVGPWDCAGKPVARDAVCSSSDATHDSLIKLYTDRFNITAWPAIATA
jgi:hypothetical protein